MWWSAPRRETSVLYSTGLRFTKDSSASTSVILTDVIKQCVTDSPQCVEQDCGGVLVFTNMSPTFSRSHTVCAALQKLEQRSRAPSRRCTLDTRGCRSQTLTQWVSGKSERNAKKHQTAQSFSKRCKIFKAIPCLLLIPTTRWRCQRNSTTWSQRSEEGAPATATSS